jgi:hypothetical protein
MLKLIKDWWKVVSTPTNIRYFIVLPGEYPFPILSLTGVSLKEIHRKGWLKHKGLKYYVCSKDTSQLRDSVIIVLMAPVVRQDILDLIFHKQLMTYQEMNSFRFNPNAKSKITRGY